MALSAHALPSILALLRILESEAADGSIVIRLDGRVAGQWVGELRRACLRVLEERDAPLVIDLGGVSFIEAEGVHLFTELTGRDVVLANCSAFTAEQLKAMADARE